MNSGGQALTCHKKNAFTITVGVCFAVHHHTQENHQEFVNQHFFLESFFKTILIHHSSKKPQNPFPFWIRELESIQASN